MSAKVYCGDLSVIKPCNCDYGKGIQPLSASPEDQRFGFILECIKKISAVALGVFSAFISLKLFVPFFLAGICIGIHSYMQDKAGTNPLDSVSSCAHGLLEQLTGVKLPWPVSVAANTAVMVCHIDHHEVVFVPIIGVSLGAWVGQTGSYYGALMYKKIDVYLGEGFLKRSFVG